MTHCDLDAIRPITAPIHSWFTSPARTQPNAAQAKELPLHLIQLILTHLDHVGDLARITRTSRLFYYMTLPRLYESVTLRSHAEMRYIDGRPEGFGGGSPFSSGLNTLVARSFTAYVRQLRIVGEWREHDVDDYKHGRVPDNSMVLQIAVRAALDKMTRLEAFAWELNTKPLATVYQGLLNKPTLTSLTLRCQTKRLPRPTTTIPSLPTLTTLVVYDIDPLCYPDDISLVLAGATRLENLKLHWSPRMREHGEESVNLMSMFARCLANRVSLPVKRFEMWNLYTRFFGESNEDIFDPLAAQEMTVINSMGSSDPMTVFLDDTWRLQHKHAVQPNLKMIRTDSVDREGVRLLREFTGLERLYVVSNKRPKETPKSLSESTAATPTTPSVATPGVSTNGVTSAAGTPTISEHHCRGAGGDMLAAIQTNHRGMRHLLLSDLWQLTDDALYKTCQTLPNLEQLGFSCGVPPLESLRQIMNLVPKLWAIRILIRPGSELADKVDATKDMHAFAIATEMWRPEYKNVQYLGMGERLVYKLGKVTYPPKGSPEIPRGQQNSLNAKRAGPVRHVERVSRDSVKWIDIWGMDSTEFEVPFR
ncbi:uncharacterized protein M421DRAFT_101516 [Didymella exigua CBS 183.55]|uniref:F-box domain-containing protein n=1 Tax=Didymella exigua CBS 183.55 TaxID=1150837 RepID=A0A6A5RGT2_9PLEO|nr:uncharacterized protein M421DRAFT_101516 [Didymella exigua CBS 183.55]KAF1927525.1 hypothetical protein M421DRAFT_101516 [Didymella exigua CBS 183.55]